VAVEKLQARGHPALDYTPKQIFACLEAAAINEKSDIANVSMATRAAQHADDKNYQKFLKALGGRDGD